jgi:UDP-glucose 4-epimerase
MNILVTGGAGFIGSNLVYRLLELGHNVSVIDNLCTGKIERLKEQLDNELLESLITRDLSTYEPAGYEDIDVIFHLAAFSRVNPSFKTPKLAYKYNVNGTMNVLELARRLDCRLVYAGSSTVDERYSSPYGFTKYLGEEHCRFYNILYGVRTSIARFYNVYGQNQMGSGDFATLIGIFERQKEKGEALTITGDGEQRRDFIHVSDVVEGLIAISKLDDRECGAFNLGSGKNYSVNEIAKLMSDNVKYIPERQGEARETLADISETTAATGWEPKVDLKEYLDG